MPLGQGIPIIKISAWARVPKVLLQNVEAEKKRLSIQNKAKLIARKRGFDKEGPEYFALYIEDEHFLCVPRAYQPRLKSDLVRGRDYIIVLHPRLRNSMWPPPHSSLCAGTDLVTLGPNEEQPFDQAPAFEALIKGTYQWPHGKVLALRCGAGKTPIGLKYAHHHGGRFLWVTTSTLLLEDMLGERKGIPRWLGIDRKSICVVQGERCDWEGKEAGVAMLHSLSQRDYGSAFYEHWDLVIFDEGDMLASGQFMTVASAFPCERVVLTATEKRADGMEILYQLHVGPVVYKHVEYELKPECWFLDCKSPIEHLKKVGWDSMRKQPMVNFQLTAQSLMFDDNRTDKVIEQIRKATENHGRTVLVLGDSVDGILYMAKRSREKLPHLSQGVVVGKVSPKKRDEIIQGNQVVWATSRLAYRGLDKPSFDTVIAVSLVAVNAPFWSQAVGRILRFVPNKPLPMVIVIVDSTIGPVLALAHKLSRIFEGFGWKRVGDKMIREEMKRKREEQKYDEEERRRGETDDYV